MDELKVYTGEGTLRALMERKILSWATDQYKLDGEFLYEKNGSNNWTRSFRSIDHFMSQKFTEVATPQVGDWVRLTSKITDCKYVSKVTRVENNEAWGEWNQPHSDILHPASLDEFYWEILSPEQVSEYKREQAFTKVGRKLNEFKNDDIAYVESLGVMAVVVSHNNYQEVRLHKINKREGLTAKPHQLTPISFVEQQVDLS